MQRGDIVTFNILDGKSLGIIVQNNKGNESSPTTIVLKINQKGEGEEIKNGVFIDFMDFKTVDKNRVEEIVGVFPDDLLKYVDLKIKQGIEKGIENNAKIVLVDPKNTTGREQKGKRPAILLNEQKGLVCFLTGSTTKRKVETHVLMKKGCSGLPKDSTVTTEQIGSLEKDQIIKYFSKVEETKKKEIKKALLVSLGIEKPKGEKRNKFIKGVI